MDMKVSTEFTATLGGRRGYRGIVTDDRAGREVFECPHVHKDPALAKKCAEKHRANIPTPR